MEDGKMGPRKYAAFEQTFTLFDALAKAFAPGVPLEDWEKHADEWLAWSRKKARELVDAAYNGKEAAAETPRPPERKEKTVVYANDAQARRIYGKAMNAGFTKETFKAFLERHGCKDAWHIPLDKYEALCELARDQKVASQFADDGKEF